ncbi:MAG: cytochrome d ubiquinol oxidase subunit II [bacterium]|jgi:cytochrome d ubiquinol oxidase subunit II|nr:cytochrome d ubiquinol oxidase subunit II [bacterium]
MWLNALWFALFVVILAGYLILDGFDLGVGMLHPVAARGDTERRLVLNSIGPIWDGNEVWLVVAGGVLFAAFPIVYSSLFSGFYWAMMLVLLGLILRTVAIEFRGKRAEGGWRGTWDTVFFLSSLALALLLGLAFGNVVSGVPIGADGNVSANLVDLLHPFAIWLGVTTVAMLALHGALYLNLKTAGDLQARVRGWIVRLIAAFTVAGAVTVVWILVAGHGPTQTYRHTPWLVVIPVAALVAFGLMIRMASRGREAAAFFASAAMIALLLSTLAAGLYPNLLTSSTNPRYNLTITNAASASLTLTVMLVVAVIGMPFVLLYTAGVQYLFRGKVRLKSDSY